MSTISTRLRIGFENIRFEAPTLAELMEKLRDATGREEA